MSKQKFLLAWAAIAACAAGSGAQASNMTVYGTHSGLTGATTPSASPSAITQSGYRAAGDGGWAEYDWNPTSTATADGVAVVLPSGQSSGTAGRYILRIPPGSGVSPLLYGAKGNDATDDTAAIQAALTGAVTIGAPLYFDRVTFPCRGAV
jgi:polygalacturonase